MTTRVWSALLTAAVVTAGVSAGIVHQARGAAARRLLARQPHAAVALPAAAATFADPSSGITLCYPTAWRATKAKTAELAVSAPAGIATLSLDVPTMTVHPWFIPIGMVTTKYVEALRQNTVPDAAVQETADLTVSGATARRVTARGHAAAGGAVCVDTAVVMVHKGQVYILSCDSDDATRPAAQSALDATLASVKWTK